MIILSKGYKKPETGDFGDVWFPALEDNIDRVNSHNHDGVNSEKLESKDLEVTIDTILVGAFVDQGNGYYKATVTTPGGLLIDNYSLTFRDPTTKETIYPKFQKVTATTADVYINSPQTIEVVFGV